MVESSVTESKTAAIRLPLTHHQYPTTSKVRKDSHDILVTLESVHDLYMPFWSYLVHPPKSSSPFHFGNSCGFIMVHTRIHLTCYNPMVTTVHGLSPITKLVFLSTRPPPSVIPVFKNIRRMVGKGKGA